MDEGLAGRQRHYEGWIHNLSKELNHYKTANQELSSKVKELSIVTQPKEHAKGNAIRMVWCERNLTCKFV